MAIHSTLRLLALSVIVALVAAPVLACGGGTKVPPVDPNATPSPALTIVSKDLKFNHGFLAVPAGQSVTLKFDNEDNGVLHNVAIYKDKSAKEKVYVGELFAGNKTVDYTFTAPPPGEYFFRCDVHPDVMVGSLLSK